MASCTFSAEGETARRSADLLKAISAQLGFTPQVASLLVEHPDLLALVAPAMSPGERGLPMVIQQSIGIAIAQEQRSEYCLAMHAYLGAHAAKLSCREIALNRDGQSDDARTDPLIRFAVRAARANGHVTEDDVVVLRSAGLSQEDTRLLSFAIFRQIALAFLANILAPSLDFPAYPLATADSMGS